MRPRCRHPQLPVLRFFNYDIRFCIRFIEEIDLVPRLHRLRLGNKLRTFSGLQKTILVHFPNFPVRRLSVVVLLHQIGIVVSEFRAFRLSPPSCRPSPLFREGVFRGNLLSSSAPPWSATCPSGVIVLRLPILEREKLVCGFIFLSGIVVIPFVSPPCRSRAAVSRLGSAWFILRKWAIVAIVAPNALVPIWGSYKICMVIYVW